MAVTLPTSTTTMPLAALTHPRPHGSLTRRAQSRLHGWLQFSRQAGRLARGAEHCRNARRHAQEGHGAVQ